MWETQSIGVAILILAILVDLIFGDPPWRLHPTFLLGELTKILERYLKSSNSFIGKMNGILLVFILLGITVVPIYLGLKFIFGSLGFLFYIIVSAVILKLTICINLETKWAIYAARAVESGNLEEARKIVTYFSRRDERDLSGSQIVSAIVESIAENLPDFKLSQIFYYAFFGVSGAVVARVINTLDSVIGFKTAEHIHTGWFTAKLDTLINYIPARLTVLFIVLSSAILGEDWRRGWKVARRDRRKISSTNHGWPVAAMAGVLCSQLEKPGYYTVGDKIEDPSPRHITRALRIRNVTTILFVIFFLPIIILTRTLFFIY
jgi:adenosylcobinamide-phosphate synthase